MRKADREQVMAKYTRKDEIFFTDDPRLENAIGKKVYAADNSIDLLLHARRGLYDYTLVAINKDADFCPFLTYVDGLGYNNYDAIIIKKDDNA